MLFDLRFIAHWGVSTEGGTPSRICKITPTYNENTVPFFVTNTFDISSRYTDLIPALKDFTTEQQSLGGDLFSLVWGNDAATHNGINVAFLGSHGQVSSVVVIDVIEAE